MQRRVTLGIDPGSQVTGYAFVSTRRSEIESIEMGIWTTDRARSRAEKLASLATKARIEIEARRPDVAVVESLFNHRNVRSALALAEARGVLLSVLGEAGVPVAEYPPATVKKSISGAGGASKESVRRALARTLPASLVASLQDAPLDATDALALAVCHLAHANFQSRAREVVR